MSEYWKSQPRKFCEFCKCWITDNKPSIDFHEKGKRHQEAVKQKIDLLRKKGVEDEKKRKKESSYMDKMEKAAMEAFKKDLAENPELAKQYNVKLPEPVTEGPQLPEGFVPPSSSSLPSSSTAENDDNTESKTGAIEWYEAVSDMGYPYYWNTTTGESLWEAPEKYISLQEQGLPPAPSLNQDNKDSIQSNTETQELPKSDTVEEIPLPPGVESIPLPGEVNPPSPPSPESSDDDDDDDDDGKQDRSSRGVYGIWAKVQKEEAQEQIDLQLPVTNTHIDTIAIPIPTDEPRVKFKERKLPSLGSNKGGPVAFKKRKLGGGARNVRRRDDDD
ncbi:WW domain binding protein 4 [Mactra antiquata]